MTSARENARAPLDLATISNYAALVEKRYYLPAGACRIFAFSSSQEQFLHFSTSVVGNGVLRIAHVADERRENLFLTNVQVIVTTKDRILLRIILDTAVIFNFYVSLLHVRIIIGSCTFGVLTCIVCVSNIHM